MSDAYRRMLEEQAALKRLLKPLEDAERVFKHAEDVRRLGIGSRIFDVLEQEEKRRHLAGLGSRRTIDEAVRNAMLHQELFDDAVQEAKRYGLLDSKFDLPSSVSSIIAAQREYEKLFRQPTKAELITVAHDAMAQSELVRTVVGTEDNLRLAMAALSTPWVKSSHDVESARAMANLLAIGHGINTLPAFDESFADALRDGLGDWRDEVTLKDDLLISPIVRSDLYFERGFNRDLTDFTSEAFDEGLAVAGLRDQDGECGGEAGQDSSRASAAFDQLHRFERALRDFIETVMQEAFGNDWMKRQLPGQMLESWIDKKSRAVKAGEVEQRLIDYADFTDYRVIIERKDNWRLVFQPIFGRAEDVRESFQRLFPVRIATMHSRLITQEDELLLVVETRRVLKAIVKRPRA